MNGGDLALLGDVESAVGPTLSDSHFVAMFPALARARLERHCVDPGPLVTTWLAEEQLAEAARTRQEGLFGPLTDTEFTILRMLPRPRCANSQPTCS